MPPWRPRDQCRDGARQGRRAPSRARWPTRIAARAGRGSPTSPRPRSPGRASSTCALRAGVCARRPAQRSLEPGATIGRGAVGAGAAGQCRIRLGQPDRADACRPWPRRGVRRRAGQPARLRRPRGDARILHQRRRRAGRRARPLRLPALPRGAGRGRSARSRGALSRRLSEAGRRGAGRRAWRRRCSTSREAEWLPLVRERRHRRDDGDDPRRSRRARHPSRRVLLRALAARRRRSTRSPTTIDDLRGARPGL